MQNRFIMIRGGEVCSCEDLTTGQQKSLRTRDEAEGRVWRRRFASRNHAAGSIVRHDSLGIETHQKIGVAAGLQSPAMTNAQRRQRQRLSSVRCFPEVSELLAWLKVYGLRSPRPHSLSLWPLRCTLMETATARLTGRT